MRGKELLDKMELIDPAFVEAAENARGQKRYTWVKWAVCAACICIVAGGLAFRGGLFKPQGARQSDTVEDSITSVNNDALILADAQVDWIVTLMDTDGNEKYAYSSISFLERKKYGLVPENAVGLTPENTYVITEADIGGFMGTVSKCADTSLIGMKLYHFAKFPDDDLICIADTPKGYAFYTGHLILPEITEYATFDTYLDAFKMTGTSFSVEVLSPEFTHIADINDAETKRTIVELLSGKSNIGHTEGERRFADAWYEAYGNNDVEYNEEHGVVSYKVQNSPDEDTALYNKAHDLWNRGERLIRLTSENGASLVLDYFPAIGIFYCGDGCFEVPDEDVAILNSLLNITE